MTARIGLRLWKFFWPLRAGWHRGLEVGSYFPDFSLNDIQGRKHALSDNPSGKPTILWFTNLCEDCRGKIALLQDVLVQSDARYRVLAISILVKDDPLHRLWSSNYGFPLLVDPEDVVGRRLGLSHPPNTCPIHNLFIVNPDGRILSRHHLSALSPEEFQALWRRLLGNTTIGAV